MENLNEFFELLKKIDEESFQHGQLLPINLLMKQIHQIKCEDLNVLTIKNCIFMLENNLNNAIEMAKWGDYHFL